MAETFREALVIGGTGMLKDAMHVLVDRGWTVVAVSRKPAVAAPSETGPGEFLPVIADWEAPESFVNAIVATTGRRQAELVVVWVHSPYRAPLMRELEPLIARDAVVIQVWGSAEQDPREILAAELVTLHGRRSRNVFLGYAIGSDGPRWLTHREISDGVLQAIDLPGATSAVGQIDPWSQRP